MEQSIKLDIICIDKVLRYIKLIGETYTMCGVVKKEDLLDNGVCQLAIAQALTNVYEVKKRISPTVLSKAPSFDKILLKAARNIASHDYDSLDFRVVFDRTMQLLNKEVSNELEAVINELRNNNEGN